MGLQKEPADLFWHSLQRTKAGHDLLFQMVGSFDGCPAKLVILEVVPNQFVGVQLRRVRSKEEEAELPLS